MAGSRMLKAIAILWIVFGIVNMGIIGVELVSLIMMSMAVKAFWLPVIYGLLWSLSQIAAGVIGVKNWNRPAKAKMCMIAAAVAVVFCLVYNIHMLTNGYLLWSLISLLVGIVTAAVYMLGAVYNNKLNA